MTWKFWQSNSSNSRKLSRLKELPDPVGRYLVVTLDKDPDWVWGLKSVLRPTEGRKNCFDVRVLDEHQAVHKNVIVTEYSSLDEHPELILFEGCFDKANKKVIELKEKAISPLSEVV